MGIVQKDRKVSENFEEQPLANLGFDSLLVFPAWLPSLVSLVAVTQDQLTVSADCLLRSAACVCWLYENNFWKFYSYVAGYIGQPRTAGGQHLSSRCSMQSVHAKYVLTFPPLAFFIVSWFRWVEHFNSTWVLS